MAAVAVVAAYASLAPLMAPSEPFAGNWTIDSVMVVDPATTTTYMLAPPCRVIRDGRVTLSRPNKFPVDRVIRMDLTIDGECVTLFTQLRE
jgi:hypothetical protein